MTRLGGRKFVVIMVALLGGLVIGFFRDAAVLAAFGNLATICVAAFMGAHAAADWKGGASGPQPPA